MQSVFLICFFLLIVLFIALSLRVIFFRRKNRSPYGYQFDDRKMMAAISAQGNFIDYSPITLLALWILSQQAVNFGWFLTLNTALLIGRYTHAIGLLFAEQRPRPIYALRVVGMALTFFSLLGCALSWLILL